MTKFEAYFENKFKIDATHYLRGGFWNTASQIIIVTGGLATTILFAKLLSATDYGIYKYIISIAALFSAFSLSGLGQSILQTAAKKYYTFYTETVSISLLYGLGITIVSFIGSFYYFYQQNYLLAAGCALIALIQPFTNTYQNIFTFLLGSKRYKEAAAAKTFSVMTTSVLSIGTLFITQNVFILLAVYFASNFLTYFLTHLFYHPKNTEPTPPDIFRKYISYAKHTSIRNFISNVTFRLDTILIFAQLGAAEVAVYTIANIIPEQVRGTFKNINALLLPKYAEHQNLDSIKKSMPIRSLQLFLILLLITIVYILISSFLYRLLFPNYENAIFLSQLTALSFPAAISILPFSALQSQLKERGLHLLNIQGSCITLIFTIVLIAAYGLIGAVVAKLLSRYSYLFLAYYHLYKNNV